MKEYPSITNKIIYDKTYYFQPKNDGSLMRCVYLSKKKGFTKFGSRTCLIDENSSNLGKFAVPLIKNEEAQIREILKYAGIPEATLFWEFFGEDSFAGNHNWQATDHRVVLFDISVERKGFLNPKDFLDIFEKYDKRVECIYHGKITKEIVEQIKESKFPGMSFEGLVAKANRARPNCTPPEMIKIKSKAWIDRLHTKYKDDPDKIKELL